MFPVGDSEIFWNLYEVCIRFNISFYNTGSPTANIVSIMYRIDVKIQQY